MLHAERCNSQDKHNLDLQVTFGSTAVASYKGQAITIARDGAGEYTITLPMPYLKVQSMSEAWYRPSGVILQARLTSVANIGASTAQVSLKTVVNAGTATDPDSGDVLYLTLGVTQDPANNEWGS
jgi:hypothetical protein